MEEDITKHPCYDKEKGILKGYMCPYCVKIYPTEQEAILCKESHDEFEVDYVFQQGHRFPVEVLIKRVKGNKITEIGTYKMSKLEILDESGKVKEVKEHD